MEKKNYITGNAVGRGPLRTQLAPGHAAACLACGRRLPDLSHPTPCSAVRWDGNRHVKPEFVSEDEDEVLAGSCTHWQPLDVPEEVLG
jgi:hypothetical protein